MTILHQPKESVRANHPSADWREEMRRAYRDVRELLRALGLESHFSGEMSAAATQFATFAPRPFVSRMRAGDPRDPLLLQVLPQGAELRTVPGFGPDPLAEQQPERHVAGLLQKYAGRALLITTGTCPVHCRYCFRRHFPYAAANPRKDQWRAALDAIASDDSLHEIILSGGDPLTLDDAVLGDLVRRLADIPHLTRLRVHTRTPIMIPQRATSELAEALLSSRLRVVVVAHANHAQELDAEVAAAFRLLHAGGAMLFNQAVWLRGVNDTPEAQIALAVRLLEVGVTPYYLHLLDAVAGAAHFEASESAARAAIEAMRAALPGYAVPRLAREIPGRPSKTVLA